MAVSTRIVAGAVAAFCVGAAAPVHAQSNVKLYGLIDLNVGRFQEARGAKTWQVSNGDFSTSYIGFSGKEDLGGGLAANFALESFFRPDTGRSGRVAIDSGANSDVFWARAANVGLSGAFGATKLGRITTPLFVSSLIFNPFGDSFGFSPTIRHWYTSNVPAGRFQGVLGDSGWSNALRYETPNFGGATLAVMGNLGEGGANAVGKNLGANLLYFAGPFAGTVAWQKTKNNSDLRFGGALPAGLKDQTAWQVGAAYDLSVVKFFGQYGISKTDATVDRKSKIGQAGVSVPLGGGKILASYGQLKDTGSVVGKSKIGTLGYDYNLSKRTDVYATYLKDKYTNRTDGNTFAFGVRHTF